MKAGTKKICLALGVIGGALFITIAVIAFKLTRQIEPQWVQDPNPVEAYEADRKIRLLSEAEARAKGFVRLSEVEINSYLQQKLAPGTNTAPSSLVLRQAGVQLASSNVTFVCWANQKLLGLEIPLVYQRSYDVGNGQLLSEIQLQSIKIGDLEIPKFLWNKVESVFTAMDTRFEERRNWVAKLPAVRLTRNELTDHPEVRLYNFTPRDL